MAIKVKITNSEIGRNAEVLNNLQSRGIQDIDVEVDNVQIYEAAKVMDGWSDVQIGDAIFMLREYMDKLDSSSKEYKVIQKALQEIDESPANAKDVLKNFLTQLAAGTLSNIFGKKLF